MEDLKAQLEQTAEPWLDVNESRNQILLSVQFHGVCPLPFHQPDNGDELSVKFTEENLPFCRLIYNRLFPRFLPPAPDSSRLWLISTDGRHLRQRFQGLRNFPKPDDQWQGSSLSELPGTPELEYHVAWHAFADDQTALPAQPFAAQCLISLKTVDICLHLPALELLGHTRVFPKLAEKDFLIFRPLSAWEGLKAGEMRPSFFLLSLPDKAPLKPERIRQRALAVAEQEMGARQCLLKYHSQKLLGSLDAMVRQLLEQDSVSHQKALNQLSHLWLASDLGMLPGVHVSLLKKLCIACDDLTMTQLGRSHAASAPVATDRLRAHLLRQCLTN